MTKDTIALGIFAGTVSTLPQLLLDWALVKGGVSHWYAFQIAGSVYLFKHLTYKPWGFILGGLVWESVAAGLGILTAYLILLTGREYWWLKGILVSNSVMFTLIYGGFYALGGPKIVPWDLGTNWTMFVGNLVFGVTAARVLVKVLPHGAVSSGLVRRESPDELGVTAEKLDLVADHLAALIDRLEAMSARDSSGQPEAEDGEGWLDAPRLGFRRVNSEGEKERDDDEG